MRTLANNPTRSVQTNHLEEASAAPARPQAPGRAGRFLQRLTAIAAACGLVGAFTSIASAQAGPPYITGAIGCMRVPNITGQVANDFHIELLNYPPSRLASVLQASGGYVAASVQSTAEPASSSAGPAAPRLLVGLNLSLSGKRTPHPSAPPPAAAPTGR
jgi:hypothetical protein